jgi:predicted NBD/HSP70 family sugar kinase
MNLIFNIGGTKIKLAVSPDGSTVPNVITMDTPDNPEAGFELIKSEVNKITGRDKISAVCGGIAGVWDPQKTKLLRSPNLKGWEKKPLKKKLEEIFDAKVYLQNDVALEGLGEATSGAGRRKQTVAYMAIGTGIGGVKIHEGKICPTAMGFEPGFQIIDYNGKIGYFEEFAGGPAMEKVFGAKPEEIINEEAWEKETRILSIGIHNAIVFWSPEIVILGGSVMQSVDLTKLTDYIAKEMKIFPKLPEIVRSELSEKSGLVGALAYLKQQSPSY